MSVNGKHIYIGKIQQSTGVQH